MNLSGQTVVVTGGAVRVGRAISLSVAERGTNLVIAYNSSEESAHDLVEMIGRKNPDSRALALKCNVARAVDVSNLIEQTVKEFGSIDALVNNAAIFPRRAVTDLTENDFDEVIGINLKGSYLCALEAGKRMLNQPNGGHIIQIADVHGVIPRIGYTPYCISKAGVIMLTKTLAREFGERSSNVRINCVAPGIVLPEEGSDQAALEVAIKRNAIKRTGSPDDVARTVIFLLEGPDFITGETIFVDGGRHLF
ncbi:MAG: SDR family NAD(P)-dependent oxidoreductase [Pyrinomonadaceae bacterium]